MKTENSLESDVLHTDVSVKDKPEIKTENLDEFYVLQTDVSISVKDEPEMGTENPADLYGYGTVGKEIKSETENDVLHPQPCDVKCEGEIKTDVSFLQSLQVTQGEESGHVNKSDDGCEMGDDDSLPSLETESGSPKTEVVVETGHSVSDSPSSDINDSLRSSVRAEVLNFLEITGFSNVATKSSANKMVEMLMTGTLDTPDQLSCVLGINPSTPTTGVLRQRYTPSSTPLSIPPISLSKPPKTKKESNAKYYKKVKEERPDVHRSRRQSQAQASRSYRESLKEPGNEEKLKKSKQDTAERMRKYRQNKKNAQENTKLQEAKSVKVKSRKDAEADAKKREKNRLRKKDERASWSHQKLTAERKKARDRYYAKKATISDKPMESVAVGQIDGEDEPKEIDGCERGDSVGSGGDEPMENV